MSVHIRGVRTIPPGFFRNLDRPGDRIEPPINLRVSLGPYRLRLA